MSSLPRDLKVSVVFSVLAVVSVFVGFLLGWLIPSIGIANIWQSVSIPLLVVAFILQLNVTKASLNTSQMKVHRLTQKLIVGTFVGVIVVMVFVFGFFLLWLQ